MTGQYIVLKWKDEASRRQRSFTARENAVRIGQEADCDVSLPNTGRFADELFAVIKPAKSAEQWQIIPVSAFVTTLVNGSPVGLNHYLESGDRITFSEGGTEILFRTVKGELDALKTQAYVKASRRWVYFLTAAVALAALLAVYAIVAPSIRDARLTKALSLADASIYKIKADSVFLIRQTAGKEEITARTAVAIPGTAFIIADGSLVTARHCIEPWINYTDIEKLSASSPELPRYVAFALFAESYNWNHRADTTYRLVSKCSLYDASGAFVKDILSSDFLVDTSRDDILELGDFGADLYWRSISPGFGRKDMMMGDLAVMRAVASDGGIELLSKDKMQELLKAGNSLYFRGFPLKHQGAGMEKSQKRILNDYEPGLLISHEKLEHGYSGSPALVVYKERVYACGVLSTLDDNNSSSAYSVPISELDKIR